jgi:hypothetical protein
VLGHIGLAEPADLTLPGRCRICGEQQRRGRGVTRLPSDREVACQRLLDKRAGASRRNHQYAECGE